MLMRPFLMLNRARLIVATLGSILVAVIAFAGTSADGLTDFGVLWHHFCGCPPDPTDVRVLRLSLTVICACTGAVLGLVSGLGASSGTSGGPGAFVIGDTRFLLTRPMPRRTVLMRPLLVALAMIALLPVFAYAVLLGWLWMVHAAALEHLTADFALVPAVAMLGPHPSLFATLSAAHAGRSYAAAVSVGLCAYAMLAATRWIVLSKYKWLRYFALLPLMLLPLSPPLLMLAGMGREPSLLTWALMVQPRSMNLDARLSLAGIGLHIVIAAVILFGCYKLMVDAEL